MILVTCAAGQTGMRLIPHLVKRGQRVRGLVTRQESAMAVAALGAEPVFGDVRDDAAMKSALRGVEKLYYIPPSLAANEEQLNRSIVGLAREAGIRHFVLQSAIAPYLQDVSFHWAKLTANIDLFHSGLGYTILIPANFMQNIMWTWPLVIEHGRWELPYRTDLPLAWVDCDDLAEAAANVLTGAGGADVFATYELAGAVLSRDAIAKLASAALGRPVAAVRADPDAFMAKLKAAPRYAGRSSEEFDQIRGMFAHYDRVGCPAGNTRTLSMLLGRPATDYAGFLTKLVAEQGRAGSGQRVAT
jgi:NAD(P)H dehydrogenase (quinone)